MKKTNDWKNISLLSKKQQELFESLFKPKKKLSFFEKYYQKMYKKNFKWKDSYIYEKEHNKDDYIIWFDSIKEVGVSVSKEYWKQLEVGQKVLLLKNQIEILFVPYPKNDK